jgi:RNA 3'-terminal phosphate cyclase (ATP)
MLQEIDGSYGEGGGQILRGAIALSALTGKASRIHSIRAKRPNPGLQPQHTVSLLAAAKVCGAKISGVEVGSLEVEFRPGPIHSGRYNFDIGTAGSATLVIQALLPILSFGCGSSEVIIEGGTDVPWSPGIDYVRQVMIPNLDPLGVRASVDVARRGHYPRGGGKVVLKVDGITSFLPFRSDRRGEVRRVTGISHCTNLPGHVASRQARTARNYLTEHGLPVGRIDEEVSQTPSGGQGSGILLVAETSGRLRVGADALGAKGKRAEEVGLEAACCLANELESGMAADRHMGDMAVIYMAAAVGTSELGVSSMTAHTETMMWLSQSFLGVKWESSMLANASAVLRVDGAGLRRSDF